ncbi:Uncharacterized protein TCM_017031 [Theobroma cacao]|uniref:Uncharacterized protein n=1 Tax=Theobroma cacao TaxID=3641 RepID=A0A061EDW9_THECC|nr:Uncharacterized protein TCM_017031 [Theobroma cacao]
MQCLIKRGRKHIENHLRLCLNISLMCAPSMVSLWKHFGCLRKAGVMGYSLYLVGVQRVCNGRIWDERAVHSDIGVGALELAASSKVVATTLVPNLCT